MACHFRSQQGEEEEEEEAAQEEVPPPPPPPPAPPRRHFGLEVQLLSTSVFETTDGSQEKARCGARLERVSD